MMHRNAILGREIRALRFSRAMTLIELASKSGLSASYISQIERAMRSPSEQALLHISHALGTEPDWFDVSRTSGGGVECEAVVRKGQRRRMAFSRLASIRKSANRNFLLSPSLEGDLVMTMMVLEPGEGEGDELIAHPGQEVGYVLSGSLTLTVGNKMLELDEGDSWFLNGEEPHSYANGGVRKLELVIVNTPVVTVLR